MASIKKTRTGTYHCQVRIAGFKARRKTFQSREEATAWASEQEFALRRAIAERTTPATLGDETLRELGLQYCRTMLRGKSSEYQTTRRIERMATHFPQPFKEITKWDVNNYRITRLQTVSTTTCRHELVLINRLFRWVKREFLIDIDNPCEHVAFPKPRKPRDKVVEEHELKLLMKHLPPAVVPVVELAYETAMRRSEIVNLRVKHVHLNQRIVSVVDGKEGDRSVPLSTRATEILRTVMEGCYSSESRLFPMATATVSQAFQRARDQAGLSKDIRFHQLRHTRCTLVARKGFNQAQMMVVTGHKDIRSVQRYTHLNAADVVKLLD